MKGVIYNVKACINFDSEVHCCDCDCIAGGVNKKSKDSTKKHAVCVHVFPVTIKITNLLCYFMVDDLCYELEAHLINRNANEKYDFDKIESTRLSVMALTSVDIASRGDILPISLNTINVFKALNSNFNVGTEKTKSNTSYK